MRNEDEIEAIIGRFLRSVLRHDKASHASLNQTRHMYLRTNQGKQLRLAIAI
ncbi:MAG: hypothetical protein AAF327_15165 [Cyanobacteria bacterium P01_A01_bin.37]